MLFHKSLISLVIAFAAASNVSTSISSVASSVNAAILRPLSECNTPIECCQCDSYAEPSIPVIKYFTREPMPSSRSPPRWAPLMSSARKVGERSSLFPSPCLTHGGDISELSAHAPLLPRSPRRLRYPELVTCPLATPLTRIPYKNIISTTSDDNPNRPRALGGDNASDPGDPSCPRRGASSRPSFHRIGRRAGGGSTCVSHQISIQHP